MYSIALYFLSWLGYYMMDQYQQGLHLQTSKEMFLFSVWESLFLISMALGFFFSWQTYSRVKDEVHEVTLQEVYTEVIDNFGAAYDRICTSKAVGAFMKVIQPLLDKLEEITGRGGILSVGRPKNGYT